MVEAFGNVHNRNEINSSLAKAHRSAHEGKEETKAHAIGTPRGVPTTRLHLLTDMPGRPYMLAVTAEHIFDMTGAGLLRPSVPKPYYLFADKGMTPTSSGSPSGVRQTSSDSEHLWPTKRGNTCISAQLRPPRPATGWPQHEAIYMLNEKWRTRQDSNL